jgi:hypothetical protein
MPDLSKNYKLYLVNIALFEGRPAGFRPVLNEFLIRIEMFSVELLSLAVRDCGLFDETKAAAGCGGLRSIPVSSLRSAEIDIMFSRFRRRRRHAIPALPGRGCG